MIDDELEPFETLSGAFMGILEELADAQIIVGRIGHLEPPE
jgi:hypothetical protein